MNDRVTLPWDDTIEVQYPMVSDKHKRNPGQEQQLRTQEEKDRIESLKIPPELDFDDD